jgi:hypothetical protein
MSSIQAFEQGWDAASRGVSLRRNPYSHDTTERVGWSWGWSAFWEANRSKR